MFDRKHCCDNLLWQGKSLVRHIGPGDTDPEGYCLNAEWKLCDEGEQILCERVLYCPGCGKDLRDLTVTNGMRGT